MVCYVLVWYGTRTREVEPLRMAELVADEVEVRLSGEPVRHGADHLVERDAARDDHMFGVAGVHAVLRHYQASHVRVHGLREGEHKKST